MTWWSPRWTALFVSDADYGTCSVMPPPTTGGRHPVRGRPTYLIAGKRPASLPGVAADEGLDARRHFLAVDGTVEDAVMAHAGLDMVLALVGGQAGAQTLGGFGHAESHHVVVLALQGEERGVADRGAIDEFAVVGQLALG